MVKSSLHRKQLVEEIRRLSQSQGLNTVFTTFLEIAATSIAAQMDPQNAAEREARYQELASNMTPKTLDAYARMLALLWLTVIEHSDDPCDILGDVYHELRLNNEWNGHYLSVVQIHHRRQIHFLIADFKLCYISRQFFKRL